MGPAGRWLRAGQGCGLSGTSVRAVGLGDAASFPSVAPAAAALGPGWSRRAAGGTSGRGRRARGCQELRWRRGGGDKAERGGEGGRGRRVRAALAGSARVFARGTGPAQCTPSARAVPWPLLGSLPSWVLMGGLR